MCIGPKHLQCPEQMPLSSDQPYMPLADIPHVHNNNPPESNMARLTQKKRQLQWVGAHSIVVQSQQGGGVYHNVNTPTMAMRVCHTVAVTPIKYETTNTVCDRYIIVATTAQLKSAPGQPPQTLEDSSLA